jgi:transposase
MSLRTEFIHLAELEKTNFSQLCRRFGISRKTGHKWLKRYREVGEKGLGD